jgi:hypothetical protein
MDILSKKHKCNRPPIPSKVFFTLQAVRLLKDALCLFEQVLLQNTRPLPNLDFAAETLGGLKIKIEEMLQGEDWEKETPFDYNEIHILSAAVHMYLVELQFSHRENLVPVCITLCKEFTRMIEQERLFLS